MAAASLARSLREIQSCLDTDTLVRVLADWCPPLPGYHLYYPSRRQQPPAFALFVEALKRHAAGDDSCLKSG